ncbi:hypothetical protein FPV67DRAFT_616662 [Lyophyllum atratum]|nr:hypothetical protein FPV67DRAFT_616662 [Lyophyllum atratum]
MSDFPGVPTSGSAPASICGTLLSPPPRGRGSSSHQDLGQIQQQHTRGRSSTRTASSSLSDRDRSTGQHSSSIGSLSPDGIEFGNVAGAYAGGRLDREREREREREKEKRGGERERSRGRDRSEAKKLSQSQSVSPDGVQDSLLRVSPASTAPLQHPPASAVDDHILRLGVSTKSTSSSSSSSCSTTSSTMTVVPSNPTPLVEESLPAPTPGSMPIDVRRAEEAQRNLQPTPSNSPIIFMQPVPAAISAPSLDKAPGAHSTPTYTTKAKSPLSVPAPHPAKPSTSYSISPPPEFL